jgi:hypothetical protein
MWCPKKCGGVCPLPTEGLFIILDNNHFKLTDQSMQNVAWFAA